MNFSRVVNEKAELGNKPYSNISYICTKKRSTSTSLLLTLSRFIAFVFVLHVLMISFTTDKPIPFFAPPNLFAFAAFLSLSLLAYQCCDKKILLNEKLHIASLLFGVVILFLALSDLISHGTSEWWIVYGSLSFVPYYLAFAMIFNEKEALLGFIKTVLYTLLVLSLCLMFIEIFQVIVLDATNDMLINKTSKHYNPLNSGEGLLFQYRPLGLTGSYTVNSALIIIAAQFLLMVTKAGEKRKGFSLDEFLIIGLATIAVITTLSGTGFVMLAFFLGLNLMEKLSLKINVISVLVSTVVLFSLLLLVGYSFDIYRITPGYFFHNYFILVKDLQIFVELRFIEMLFGTAPALGLGHIDTGPSVMLMKTGLIGLGAYLAFFVYLYRNSMGRERVLVILFAIGSLRYPVIWNQTGQMILALNLLSKVYLSQVSLQSLQRR